MVLVTREQQQPHICRQYYQQYSHIVRSGVLTVQIFCIVTEKKSPREITVNLIDQVFLYTRFYQLDARHWYFFFFFSFFFFLNVYLCVRVCARWFYIF